ncbi:MAG: alpha/beta hydrolase [Lachnospiraceae bacterium]|nr:alpha/beta hydrolase [Lachnospiraceae bacterium]
MTIMGVTLIQILLIYLVLSFLLTFFSVLRMYIISDRASGKKLGSDRIKELKAKGRYRQYPIYSLEEIKEKKKRGAARLSVFMNDSGKKSRCVIVCPGGGYAHLQTKKEGYPIAARLNELGYTAFVLEYRAGLDCSTHAPMHDLAQAIRFIEARSGEFNVDMQDYAVIGFSAGGNLAGIFGTDAYGYDKYNVKKPGCLIMGYPWTNVNHWMQHPYWNIWVAMMGVWLSERGNMYMFGKHNFNRKKRESLCLQNWITDDYPPVYMYAGGNDILVPSASHTDVLAKALDDHQVVYEYEKFFGLPHGVGLGLKTNAEGWLEHALDFWEKNCPSHNMTE